MFKMLPESFFEKLKEKVKKEVGEKGSHDIGHIERVYKLSILISKDLNVDMDVIRAAALFHDIAKHKEKKKKKDHAMMGAKEALKILKRTEFPKEKLKIVEKCILLHNKSEDIPELKEVRVLKEADGLESMGAIGIARHFAYNGDEEDWNNSNVLNELTRNLNLNYFKLPIAKEYAQRRIAITQSFCTEFKKEFNLTI